MSKILNPTKKNVVNQERKEGRSYNGNPQFVKNSAQQLFELASMSLLGKDNFYESSYQQLVRVESLVEELVSAGKFDLLANMIVYVRSNMYIRSMPIVLTVLMTKVLREQNKTYNKMRSVVRDVVQRADEITDLYSFALTVFGSKKAVPMSIKRGIADAMNKFDEYQFAKYSSNKKSLSFKDVLRIVHPKAANLDQSEIFSKIMKDSLETPYTWETALSVNGQLDESEQKSKDEIWSELIRSKKLGYMALLRNLRNILEANVDSSVLNELCNTLKNEALVKKSKQLPFRFATAMNQISVVHEKGTSKVLSALSKALDISLGNIPILGDDIEIIIDCSGSMTGSWYANDPSKSTPMVTATLLAAALIKSHAEVSNLTIAMFSNNAELVKVDPNASVKSIQDQLIKKVYGGGTNVEAAFKLLSKKKTKPDVRILLSDMQVNQLTRTNIADGKSDVINIAFNLAAYQSTPVSEVNGWYQIAGWSDKVFDWIEAMKNKQSIVSTFDVPYE